MKLDHWRLPRPRVGVDRDAHTTLALAEVARALAEAGLKRLRLTAHPLFLVRVVVAHLHLVLRQIGPVVGDRAVAAAWLPFGVLGHALELLVVAVRRAVH